MELYNDPATSYAVQAGAGRNFNKTYGVNVEFDWANFGFQTATLNNQLAILQRPSANKQAASPSLVEPATIGPFPSTRS